MCVYCSCSYIEQSCKPVLVQDLDKVLDVKFLFIYLFSNFTNRFPLSIFSTGTFFPLIPELDYNRFLDGVLKRMDSYCAASLIEERYYFTTL